jgi:hypothetical protein
MTGVEGSNNRIFSTITEFKINEIGSNTNTFGFPRIDYEFIHDGQLVLGLSS